jgi:hypothetical protein
MKKVSASLVRPANTTVYTVGDAITDSTSAPTIFELDLSTIGAVNGQSLIVQMVSVVSSVKQSTLPLVNVFLSPTTFAGTNDNSALAIDDATVESGGQWFQCDYQNYSANNAVIDTRATNIPIVLASDNNKLFGTIQAFNAYTPVSGEKFTVSVWVALL